ncbi:MAG: pyridoxal-dependent decarboxylase [Bacilli bacterium]|nr:pyridoxal-dependent decarboxylase [Bacilli bacterium]
MDKSIITDLKTKYGDAFYLLDSKQFRTNYDELKSTFSSVYPNFNIAYSYKTNYTPKLCKIVNEQGGYAEVVSEMEMELALRIGVKPENIIWNGPVKNKKELERFLLLGGLVNVDSLDDLELIKPIVENNKDKIFKLGIRVNYDVEDGVISRFGFDINDSDFAECIKYVTKTSNVDFVNFQCHFAKRNAEYWPARAKGMIELIDRIGVIPKRIDLGGGMFGKMAESLKAQFTSNIPDYEAYAETVRVLFDRFGDKGPELIIEPGSALVGDCMKFVGTIKTIKCVRGKWFASILGSQKNISMTGVNPPIEIVHMGQDLKEYDDIDFVGFTCIEGDVIYRNYSGLIAKDDVIIISNCGSYSIVMKPPFILPNFPILEISEERIELIKRGESFDDLFHTFEF